MIKVILALDASCFIYSLIFFIVFFSKKRIKSFETDLFAFAIITTLVGVVIETLMLGFAMVDYNKFYSLISLISFLYVAHYYVMFLYLIIYVILKAYSKKHDDHNHVFNLFKKLIMIFSGILLTFLIITYLLNGEVKFTGDSLYGTGGSIFLIVLVGFAYGFACLITLIRNGKLFTKKENTFYIFSIVLLSASGLIRVFNPELMINNIINSLIIAIMFFTIENPDIKLITELKEANDAKDKFLASMSHEMRTPLNAIIGLSSLGDISSEDCKDIKNQADVLLDIVNNVIETNSFNADIIKTSKTEFNLLSSLTSIINETSSSVEGKNINFNYNVPDVIINANGSAIIGIVDKILSNSVKYTNEGFINLYLAVNNNILNINIKDSGIGMDEDTLKNIYNKFERNNQNKNGVIPGLGLGLSLVKDTVDALGGTILITSKPGEGTTVDINIALN